MKLVSYTTGEGEAAGVWEDQSIFPLAALATAAGIEVKAPGATLPAVLAAWEAWRPALALLSGRELRGILSNPLPLSAVRLLAPVRRPGKLIMAGANYYSHLMEMGHPRSAASQVPFFFLKPAHAVIGPEEPIVLPPDSRQVDWEAELGVVIGRRCRAVSPNQALEMVAGYTVINDVTARDRLHRSDTAFTFDWIAAKGRDTFGPMGPCLVPGEFLPDPQSLPLGLRVNGAAEQDANTSDMIVPISKLVAAASALFTLEPGDVIATGTPAGVGVKKGKFLQPGDVVEAWVEGIGVLRNPVRKA